MSWTPAKISEDRRIRLKWRHFTSNETKKKWKHKTERPSIFLPFPDKFLEIFKMNWILQMKEYSVVMSVCESQS